MRPYQWTSIISFLLGILILWQGWLGNVSYWWLFMLGLFYIHALALGAVFIRWNFYVPALHRGKEDRKIALTFDDGPVPHTQEILSILKAEKVPAAFFLIGKNLELNPEIAAQILNDGHIVGNHSYSHSFHFDWQSCEKMVQELQQTNELLNEIAEREMRLFRPPYGVTNPNLAKAIKATGMTTISWSLRSFDTTANDEEKLLKKLLTQLKGGDVVLLHDTMPITAAVLPRFIKEARKRGFVFAPLDEILLVTPYA